jgi:cleavage and polyadenylation specificity factor subunit 3
MKVFSPANCEELRIPFRTDKVAKVVGKLAQIHPPLPYHLKKQEDETDGDQVTKEAKIEEELGITGVLVQNEFKLSLMAPEDLKEYAGLTTTTILCRQHLTLRAAGVDLIRWALQAAFGEIQEISKKDEAINGKVEANGHGKKEDADEEIERSTRHFLVMGAVHIAIQPDGHIEVEWEGNMLNDGVADAVIGVLLSVERTPASVRQSSTSHNHSHANSETALQRKADDLRKQRDPKEKMSRLLLLLESQFGQTITPITTPPPPKNATITPPPDGDVDMSEKEVQAALERLERLGVPVPGVEISVNGQTAKVWLEDMSVESKSAVLRGRVEAVVREAFEGVAELWG